MNKGRFFIVVGLIGLMLGIVSVAVGQDELGCVNSWGYWKNHTSNSANPDPGWDGFENQPFFNSGLTWYQILQINVKGGNAYITLAHQYVAAWLNINANGAEPGIVAATMADAAALLAQHSAPPSPPVIRKNDPNFALALSLAARLDQFNKGEIGPTHCECPCWTREDLSNLTASSCNEDSGNEYISVATIQNLTPSISDSESPGCSVVHYNQMTGFALAIKYAQFLDCRDGLKKLIKATGLACESCPGDVTVVNIADDGEGSLRRALGSVCVGGTIHFSETLAGQTITLVSGPLTLGKDVTIDASTAPGLTISGNNADRVFIVNAGKIATVKSLTVTKGYGWKLGGGILNNGSLTLDHVTLTGNVMATNTGDFWQGGGGIYNASGAILNLIDSSVQGNQAEWSGGGLYSFYNTTTQVIRSTISGNVSNDVGGAIRSFGSFTMLDSTVSGNTATGWHGGAIFHTDGAMAITSCTIANNIGPDWAPSAILIGEWGAVVPSLSLTNTIISGNHWYACEKNATGGTVSLISGGHNVVQDATCNPVASDVITADALINPLADNGGPTLTHALLAGSPAIDAADDAVCSATDQRGIARPQGPHCDVGSYEYGVP